MRFRARAPLPVLAIAALLVLLTSPLAADPKFETALKALRQRSFDEAMATFRSLAAAGEARAAFMIGVMHEEGFGRAKDDAAARAWYARAADDGVASAQYNLAVFLQTGRGGLAEEAAAAHWFARAAGQGHARAQNNLAALYFTGAGVPRDAVEAWKWQKLALDGLQGEELAAARDNLAKIEAALDKDELAAARERAAAWQEVR